MIELTCSICGVTERFRNREEAIDRGWNWFDIRYKLKNGKKARRFAAFCPGHDAKTIEDWLMNNVFKKEGIV